MYLKWLFQMFMKKLHYWLLTLALSALMPLGLLAQNSAGAQSFQVKLKEVDEDAVMAGDFHNVNLALHAISEVRSVMYDDVSGVFWVKAESGVSHGLIQQRLHKWADVTPVSEALYSDGARRYAARKLSVIQSSPFAGVEGYPARNTDESAASYQTKIEEWLKSHPEKFSQLF